MTAISNVDRVSYRNVLLTGVTTERFNQELIFAPGDNAPQFTRFHIQVSSYLHLDREQALAIDIFGTAPPPLGDQNSNIYANSALKCRAIQEYLMVPKGRFLYWSGGQLMLDVGNRAAYGTDTEDSSKVFPAGVLSDMDNGPKPQDVEVVETAAGNIYKVRFGISFSIMLCDTYSGEPGLPLDQQIINDPPNSDETSVVHSWSYVESKDQRFWSTKTLTGSIRVRNEFDWAHSLRWLVVPPLQKTYRRQAQRFVQSTDKLTLEYQVTDKQEFASPPAPATDWTCRYHQSFTGPVAKQKIETVSVRLDGAPGTDKRDLVRTAFEVVRAILPSSMDPAKKARFQREEELANPAGPRFPTSFLHHAQIIDTVSDTTIELIISFRTIIADPPDSAQPPGEPPKASTIQNLYVNNVGLFPSIRVNSSDNTGTPEWEYHDRSVWYMPGLFDSDTPIGLFSSYVQSACGARHGIVQPYQLTFRDEQGDITSGPPTGAYGTRKGLFGDNGTFAETWETAEPVQPEQYDYQSATALKIGSDGNPEGNMQFPLTEVELESEYQEDHGTMILPKANSGIAAPYVETFSFHAPVLRRVSRAVASRVGGWPRMPRPEKTLTTDSATETLIDYKVVFEEPRTEEHEQTPTYRAHALMVYSVDRGILDMSRLRTGVSPAMDWSLLYDLPAGVNNPTMVDTNKLTNDMFGGDISPP